MALSIPVIAIAPGGGASLPRALSANGVSSKDAAFAALLGKKLATLTGDDDFTARIAALLQSGTAMTTIVNSIAAKLTGAILSAAGKNGDANARSTLQRALAGALAPPGTSPPKSLQQAQQLAATLEQRLKDDLLAPLSSEQPQTAGQKNEIPGNLLDALPAKESPAPQSKPATPARVDAALAFAPPQSQPVPAQTAQEQPVTQQPPLVPMTAQSAADILTRIISRAITADSLRTGIAPAAQTAPIPTAATVASTSTTPLTPASVLFDRLVAAIAQQNAANGDSSHQGGDSQNQAQNQSAQPEVQTGSLPGGPPVTQVSTAPIQSAPVQSPVSPYTTFDPNAVIEQIVKGIVIQNSGESSQIRLRLQPEQLGEVTMKLTVTGNSISATVIASNANVRDTLLSGQSRPLTVSGRRRTLARELLGRRLGRQRRLHLAAAGTAKTVRLQTGRLGSSAFGPRRSSGNRRPLRTFAFGE